MIAAVVTAAVLTKPQYQALLSKANARITVAEGAAERGITPKASPVRVATLLEGWAAAEATNARMFASVSPPVPVRAANDLLADGERIYADEIRQAAREVRVAKSPRAVVVKLLSHARGPRLVDRALAQLKKLGY
jgi:hypothetical protein